MNTPKLLTSRQYAGLLKVGDILIPGDNDLPPFSSTLCAVEADRMLAHMYPDDRAGVRMLLGIFGLLPRFLIHAVYWLTEQHASLPEFLAAPLRMANLGIKGVVMTLYYSDVGIGRSIFTLIGWDARVGPAPDEAMQ
jgi:hypothetical protein